MLRAADLRRALVGVDATTDPLGLWIVGAEIAGQLDLSSIDVPIPLRFDDCVFSDVVRVGAAKLRHLALRGCTMPGLSGNGVRISGDLDLSKSVLSGHHATEASTTKEAAIWLVRAEIDGKWLCVGTKIAAGGQRSIHADGIHVGGTIRLIEGFEADGQVRLLGAQVGGSLDLSGVRLERPIDGLALDLGDVSIAGGLFVVPGPDGSRPRIAGQVDLGSARVGGQCLFRSLTIDAKAAAPRRPGLSSRRRHGSALSAPRLCVGADITLEDCSIAGGVDLSMCQVGDLWMDGAVRLSSPGETALDLSNARLLGTLTLGAGFKCRGRLDLTSAQVGGRLNLVGTAWSEALRGIAVNGPSLSVGGDIDCHSLSSSGGGLNFRAGNVGGNVELTGATLSCLGKPFGLNLSQATVGGTVYLRGGLVVRGLVQMDQAAIAGNVDLRTATLTLRSEPDSQGSTAPTASIHSQGPAFQMKGTEIRGSLILRGASLEADVDLSDSSLSVLADSLIVWPRSYSIAGLAYGRFDDSEPDGVGLWDCRARIAWIEGQRSFDAGSYEQLASVYRRHGYTEEAERVLIAQRRSAVRLRPAEGLPAPLGRRLRSYVRLAWSLVLGVLVGYGYRPARVINILMALTAGVAFALAQPVVNHQMRAVDPQGVVFTVDGPLLDQSELLPPSGGGACGHGRVRCFNPVSYAIETVIPLVSLGQRSAWYPNEESRLGRRLSAVLNASSLLGWLLSSVFVLSFTRLGRGS